MFAKSGMSANKGLVHALRKPCYVVNHLATLVPKVSSDGPFLVRLLEWDSPSRLIRDPAYPSIRLSDIEDMVVTVPADPQERARIASILDLALSLRSKRNATLASLDMLARSTFLEMFGDPVTNPRRWPEASLSDLGDIVTGNTPSRSVTEYYGDDIEWIKSDNLNTPHDFATQASEGLSARGRGVARTAPSGSILVTCIAGSPECIGNAAMIDREVAFNQQINAVIPRGSDTAFLYTQILVGKKLIQEASTGAMKGMVSKSRLAAIRMIRPPVELQREFRGKFDAMQQLRSRAQASMDEVDGLVASLQHRAFSGRL